MVLSENWKRLEGFFLFKFHHFYEIVEIIFFENFPPAIASTETNDTSAESPGSQL